MSSLAPITLANFTGIDFNQLIQAVTSADQIPISNLQSQVSQENVAISTLGTIGSDFSSLQSALSAINNDSISPPMAATTSSNAPFSASVSGGAIAGSYQVSVSQLATAESVASQGYTSSSAVVGTGAVTITIGGVANTVNLTSSNDTVSGLASAINSANIGVTAQVVNSGLPGSPYRLEITSNSTGSAQAFTVSSSLSGGTAPNFSTNAVGSTDTSGVTGTASVAVGGSYTGSVTQGYHFSVTSGGTIGTNQITLSYTSDSGQTGTITIPSTYAAGTQVSVANGLTLTLGSGTLNTGDKFSAAAFVPQISAAQDATVQVGNQIVTSSTNQVTNAIPGVTLSLTGVGGPSTLTVGSDQTAISNQIQAFVKAYNQLVGDIQTNTQAQPNKPAPPLAADGGLQSVLFNLQFALGTVNLSNLGVSVDQNTGQLTFSQTSLTGAEQTNPSGVTQALSGLYTALNPMMTAATDPVTGVITSETNSYQTQITQQQQQISELTQQLQQEQSQLQVEYGQIQALVSSYQSLYSFFGSSSGSSSSSSTSTAPGSNLSLYG